MLGNGTSGYIVGMAFEFRIAEMQAECHCGEDDADAFFGPNFTPVSAMPSNNYFVILANAPYEIQTFAF